MQPQGKASLGGSAAPLTQRQRSPVKGAVNARRIATTWQKQAGATWQAQSVPPSSTMKRRQLETQKHVKALSASPQTRGGSNKNITATTRNVGHAVGLLKRAKETLAGANQGEHEELLDLPSMA